MIAALNWRKRILITLIVLALKTASSSEKQLYQKGAVVEAPMLYLDAPPPLASSIVPISRIPIGYSLRIRVGDFTYFVSVVCCPPGPKHKPEWTAGDRIEFRFDKDKMFVKRPIGKELRAKLVKIGIATENPPPSPVPRDTPQVQSFLEPPSKQTKTLPLGIDFVRAGDTCLILDGDVIAGDFFDGLQGHRSANGIEFRKGGQKVEAYPERLTVRIFAALGFCSSKERSLERSTPILPRLDDNFMRSVTFDGAWKHGFDERVADIGPVVEGRIANPTRLPSDRDWWEYQFEVRSEGVNLTDALVVVLQSPDGRLLARLSGRVGGSG